MMLRLKLTRGPYCVLGVGVNDLLVELELMSSKNKNSINLMM